MTTITPSRQALLAATILATTVAGCGLFADDGPTTTPGPSASADAGESAGPSGGPSPSPEPTGTPAPPESRGLPDGWAHAMACNDNGRKCRLHLRDERGNEVPGWPVDVPGSCWDAEPVTGSDGTVYADCTQARSVRLHAFDTMGRPVDGWPVRLQGRSIGRVYNDFNLGLTGPRGIDVTSDGQVVAGTAGARGQDFTITMLGGDGRVREGWPVALPGAYQGFTLASDDAVLAWWYEDALYEMELAARRTVFTRLDDTGTAAPGWPIGSRGAASGAVADGEGGIVYTSASGRVWRHDAAGRVVDGWPFQLPWPTAPVALDGRFLFVDGGGATMLEPDGSEARGWPWRARGGLFAPNCDTGGFAVPQWALGPRATLFLADQMEDNARIVQLDHRGRTVDGWPWAVPAGWVVWGLTPSADGGAVVTLGAACDSVSAVDVTLDRRGETDDVVPASQEAVYRSMQLGDLQTADAGADYYPGDAIDFSVDFANTSGGRLVLPERQGEVGSYTVGALTSFLQREGDDRSIPCLSSRPRQWHRLDQVVHEWSEPTTIRQGEAFPFSGTLDPELTSCLPPGPYRYRVLYQGWDGDDAYPTEDSAAFDFTIVGP